MEWNSKHIKIMLIIKEKPNLCFKLKEFKKFQKIYFLYKILLSLFSENYQVMLQMIMEINSNLKI